MSRDFCQHCFRTQSLCLCESIQPFTIDPLIVLLVHPREFMKTIGTVRMVKLSITGSLLIRGHGKDFDQDPTIHSILANRNYQPMILFPGSDSLNLTTAPPETIEQQIDLKKRLVIFVIDGTWSAAKNMILKSQSLSAIPKISFEVNTPSHYGFRKQPNAHSLSTLEAVSLLIENLKAKNLCVPQPTNGHLQMVESFKKLISTQREFEAKPQHREGKKFRRGIPSHWNRQAE